MKIVKYIFIIGIAILCNFVHNNYSIKDMYNKILAKIHAASESKSDNKEELMDILGKDKFKIEHTYNPYKDYGKTFGKISDIIARGELVVCAKKDDNNILFQMKTKNGDYIGKDIDFAKQIAATLGVKVVYRMVYKTYDDVVDAVARKEGDIGLAKISYTPERTRKVLYSSPYVISRKTLLINRVLFESAGSKTLRELLNKESSIIGVTKDTCYEAFVSKIFPKATMLLEEDWEGKVIKPLAEGRITATMRDEVRIKLLLKSNPQLLVKLLPIIVEQETDSMAAIVNFDCQELLLWVNKFIDVDKKNVDTVDELIARYEEDI